MKPPRDEDALRTAVEIYEEARAPLDSGEFVDAIAIYDELLHRYGDRPEVSLSECVAKALVNKGWALCQLGRFRVGIAIYDDVLHRYGARPEVVLAKQVAMALGNKAFTLRNLGCFADAIDVCDDVIRRCGDRSDVDHVRRMALALLCKGTSQEAICWFTEAIATYDRVVGLCGNRQDLGPEISQALNNRGHMFAELGRFDEALTSYDEALRLCSERKDLAHLASLALVNRGIALRKLNRYPEAIASYDEAVRCYGDRPEVSLATQVAWALLNKSYALAQLGRFREQVDSCDEVFRRYRDRTEVSLAEPVAMALFNKATALNQLGRLDEALSTYDEIVHLFSGHANVAIAEQVAKTRLNQTLVLAQLDRLDEAMAACDSVLRLYGDRIEVKFAEQVAMALLNKAAFLTKRCCLDEAIATCNQILSLFAKRRECGLAALVAEASFTKAKTLRELGHFPLAEEAFLAGSDTLMALIANTSSVRERLLITKSETLCWVGEYPLEAARCAIQRNDVEAAKDHVGSAITNMDELLKDADSVEVPTNRLGESARKAAAFIFRSRADVRFSGRLMSNDVVATTTTIADSCLADLRTAEKLETGLQHLSRSLFESATQIFEWLIIAEDEAKSMAAACFDKAEAALDAAEGDPKGDPIPATEAAQLIAVVAIQCLAMPDCDARLRATRTTQALMQRKTPSVVEGAKKAQLIAAVLRFDEDCLERLDLGSRAALKQRLLQTCEETLELATIHYRELARASRAENKHIDWRAKNETFFRTYVECHLLAHSDSKRLLGAVLRCRAVNDVYQAALCERRDVETARKVEWPDVEDFVQEVRRSGGGWMEIAQGLDHQAVLWVNAADGSVAADIQPIGEPDAWRMAYERFRESTTTGFDVDLQSLVEQARELPDQDSKSMRLCPEGKLHDVPWCSVGRLAGLPVISQCLSGASWFLKRSRRYSNENPSLVVLSEGYANQLTGRPLSLCNVEREQQVEGDSHLGKLLEALSRRAPTYVLLVADRQPHSRRIPPSAQWMTFHGDTLRSVNPPSVLLPGIVLWLTHGESGRLFCHGHHRSLDATCLVEAAGGGPPIRLPAPLACAEPVLDLSACRAFLTGACLAGRVETTYPGVEGVGLIRGLLALGVGEILASNWKVPLQLPRGACTLPVGELLVSALRAVVEGRSMETTIGDVIDGLRQLAEREGWSDRDWAHATVYTG